MNNTGFPHYFAYYINLILENQKGDYQFTSFYDKNIPRRLKGGILKIKDKAFFLKFFYGPFSTKDFSQQTAFALNFPTPKILEIIIINNNTKVIVFEYVEAKRINALAYIGHNNKIQREDKISFFFKKLSHIYIKRSKVYQRDYKYPSMIFFENRFLGMQASLFYQNNFSLLLNDISKLTPKFLKVIKTSIQDIYIYFTTKSQTLITQSHGDLYDLNFSFDWFFWDLDQSGENPILCDVSIYFWFSVAQRILLMKYNSKFIEDNSIKINKIGLKKTKKIFYIFFEKMFIPITKECSKSFNWRLEFIARMFCRCFLVSNVLDYEKEDRIYMYEIWYWLANWFYRENDINDLKNIPLFSNY